MTIHLPLWKKLTLAFAVAVATFLLGELWARIHIFGTRAFDYQELRHCVTASRAGLYRASEHRDVLFEWKPDLRTRSMLAAFETNSLGLRDREYPLDKPAGTFRIAALGDSFTVGHGVEAEESWSEVLEHSLATRPGIPPIEVWNWGVSGYHFEQYVATLEKRALATDPDLVLVGFCAANDHHLFPAEDAVFPFPERRVANGFLTCYLHRLLKERVRLRSQVVPREIVIDPDQMANLERQFVRLGELSRRHELPLVLIYLSIYSAEHGAVRALAEAAGLAFVDATGPLRYEDIPRHRLLPIDHHPNAAAHAHFAAELEPALDALGLLPE